MLRPRGNDKTVPRLDLERVAINGEHKPPALHIGGLDMRVGMDTALAFARKPKGDNHQVLTVRQNLTVNVVVHLNTGERFYMAHVTVSLVELRRQPQ